MSRVLAFYLSAFHEIEENNAFYGKSFTEWDNVRNARPLFEGHNQPRVPLNGTYYDLTDPKVLIEHMNLAKENGVYGFCFYHYWFDKSGRTVFQKPLERMLHDRSATLHYCFAWCNESWIKRWHGGGDKLIIKQKYEGEKDWEAHFNYLLKFFKDDMYIKQDDKPILLIYRLENIPNAVEMLHYFNKRAIENGYAGIYFVQMMNGDYIRKEPLADFYLDFEPNFMSSARGRYAYRLWRLKLWLTGRIKSLYKTVDYNAFSRSILEMDMNRLDSKEIFGYFCDWDNTPRMGKRGKIFQGSNPVSFKQYFRSLYEMSLRMGKPYIFLFAWNEWGEGGYLEPDTKNGFEYLKAIKEVVRG